MITGAKIEVRAIVRLENGGLINRHNMHRMRLESTRDSTRNHVHSLIDASKPYFEKYIVIKGTRGFAWKEITHGCGACGWQKSLRMLAIATLCGLCGDHFHLVIADDDLDIEAIQRRWDAHDADQRRRYPDLNPADWSDGARAVALCGKNAL